MLASNGRQGDVWYTCDMETIWRRPWEKLMQIFITETLAFMSNKYNSIANGVILSVLYLGMFTRIQNHLKTVQIYFGTPYNKAL